MLLRNKKTGEIIDVYKGQVLLHYDNGRKTIQFKSLEELDDWEDYEEPKTFWFIDEEGIIRDTTDENWPEESVVAAKTIGNYFDTREEAEKAVEKLKAWKRLKDSGLTIKQWRHTPDMNLTTGSFINIKCFMPEVMKNIKDLIRAVLKTVFGHGLYVRMYEVLDDDMIRKSAIKIVKRKEYENGDNEYVVRINWRLLDKFISEGGEE